MAKNDKDNKDKSTTEATPAAPSVEELQAKLAALQTENAELKKQVLTPEEESLVAFKVAAGLFREQALAVIKAQKEWDASPENPQNKTPLVNVPKPTPAK